MLFEPWGSAGVPDETHRSSKNVSYSWRVPAILRGMPWTLFDGVLDSDVLPPLAPHPILTAIWPTCANIHMPPGSSARPCLLLKGLTLVTWGGKKWTVETCIRWAMQARCRYSVGSAVVPCADRVGSQCLCPCYSGELFGLVLQQGFFFSAGI